MDELVLGRVGHLFTPHSPDEGACQAAMVAYVHPELRAVTDPPTVNVTGFQHDGEVFRRLDVPVEAPGTARRASFHLTRACPWSR